MARTGSKKFMKNWSDTEMDFYIAKKKAKKFFEQADGRKCPVANRKIINVGVIPFGIPVVGTSPNNHIKAKMTEQAMAILKKVAAEAETNIAMESTKRGGSFEGEYLFLPAIMKITLSDTTEPTSGASNLTGRAGTKRYKTRSGSIPFGDFSVKENRVGEAKVRTDLTVKVNQTAKTFTTDKLRGLSFLPQELEAITPDTGLEKTAFDTTATLTY